METLSVVTPAREVLVDITSQVSSIVQESGIDSGVCMVFVPHTTAAVTINENADPSVQTDITRFLRELIPQDAGFRHMEGNSDSHIKASMMGFSEHIIIENGGLVLGTWQGIYLTEFDGPRNRRVHIKIISD